MKNAIGKNISINSHIYVIGQQGCEKGNKNEHDSPIK
jgi:hypothetical protein